MRITVIILTVSTTLQVHQYLGALAESTVIKPSGRNLHYLAIFPGIYGILRVCLRSEIHLASFIYLRHTIVRVVFFILSYFSEYMCFIYKYIKYSLLDLLYIKIHNKISSCIVPNHLFWGCVFLISRDILRIFRGKYSFVWNCRFWCFCRMRRVCYALYIVYILYVHAAFLVTRFLKWWQTIHVCCTVDNFHITIES